MSASTDLLVVGAGIVGLAHAVEAHRRGLSVRVVERDLAPNGASFRNFGHCCITAQAGDLLEIAHRSREGWLRAAEAVGFWAPTAGAVSSPAPPSSSRCSSSCTRSAAGTRSSFSPRQECGSVSGRTPTPRSSAAPSSRPTYGSTRARRPARSPAGSSHGTG